MSAAAIDSNVLNSLFENQNKLDDLFDSIFDDGNYFIIGSSSSSSSQSESHYLARSGPLIHPQAQQGKRIPVDDQRAMPSLFYAANRVGNCGDLRCGGQLLVGH